MRYSRLKMILPRNDENISGNNIKSSCLDLRKYHLSALEPPNFEFYVKYIVLYFSIRFAILISRFWFREAKRIDGCYTRLLRKANGWTYRDRMTNEEVYGNTPKITKTIEKRQLAFAGHCARCTDAPQPVQHLVVREAPSKLKGGNRACMAYMTMLTNKLGIKKE